MNKINTKNQKEQVFLQALEGLNESQREAVETIEGPVAVLAGPGTGKTQVLTLRIANILFKTDTAPESILALTYTEQGARAMRARLRGFIGSDASRVRIHTFHGFAERVFREYPFSFPEIAGARALGDSETLKLWEEVFKECDTPTLSRSRDPLFYLSGARALIEELKREDISPEEFRARTLRAREEFFAREDIYSTRGKTKGSLKAEHKGEEEAYTRTLEVATIYERYETLLRERRMYDFADMILFLSRALLKDEALKAGVQEEIQYVLADEHQDTNASQGKVLELLTDFHPNPNLFVVGDEHQAIFRFQGASEENFRSILTYAPKTRIIYLTDNYRSKQSILNASHTLITHSPYPPMYEAKALVAARGIVGEKEDIRIIGFPTLRDEIRAVSEWVASDIASGTNPSEIAVLFRKNSEAGRVKRECIAQGIPHRVVGKTGIFLIPLVRFYIALLQSIARPLDDEALAHTLYAPWWGIPVLSLWRFVEDARKARSTLSESLEKSSDEKFVRVREILHTLREDTRAESVSFALARIAQETGALGAFLQDTEAYSGYEVLFRVAEEMEASSRGVVLLNDFISEISYRADHHLDIEVETQGASGSVSLMTAHKAKGLEFEKVYVIGVTDSSWGDTKKKTKHKGLRPSLYTRAISAEDIEHDERKLLYVACTRAKDSLTLTHSRVDEAGKSCEESRFLSELSIEEVLREEGSTVLPKEDAHYPQATSVGHLMGEYLKERGFSVTALNNYMDDPWQCIFRSIVRIPSKQTAPQLFGTAVDKALTNILLARTAGETISHDFARRCIHAELERLPFSKEEITHMTPRAEEAIDATLSSHTLWQESLVRPKVRLRTTLSFEEGLEVEFSGEIDVLVTHLNGSLEVVDFKTGSMKKLEERVEGERDAHYYRQLLSYAFLLEQNGQPLPRLGTLFYVEPEKGKKVARTKTVEIQEGEVRAFEGLLRRVLQELASGVYLTRECDREKCDYCDIAERVKEEFGGIGV